jgi:hypothetical protein
MSDSTDREILDTLAHWMRKHDCLAFAGVRDDEYDEQDRAQKLIAWFAESVDVLNVPPRATQVGGGE